MPPPPPAAVPDLPPCEIYCHTLSDRSILGPELAGTDAQTLTLFGLHLPARLFREDNEARRRKEALAAHPALAGLGARRADRGRAAARRRTAALHRGQARPVDLEQDLGLPGGNIFHRSLQWPWAEQRRRGRHLGRRDGHTSSVLLGGAGARRGGGVSGIPGHNAAQAVLTGLTGAPACPARHAR